MNTTIEKSFCRALVFAVGCLLLSPAQLSALELNRTFSSDMVLQRDKPVNVWGTAKEGDTITVSFAGQTVKATADKDGNWVATLKPMKANAKGQPLKVTLGTAKRSEDGSTLDNVVVGDVLLYARQSSVDVTLGATPGGKKAAVGIKGNAKLRVIRIQATPSMKPLDNLKPDSTTGWKVVDQSTALAMSSAAFHLGRDLAKEIDVPLGIIDLDMKNYFPPAWLSPTGLEAAMKMPGGGAKKLKSEVDNLSQDMAAWERKDTEYKRGYGQGAGVPQLGLSPIDLPFAPGVCYNGILHPLRGITVKGVLLQLGNNYPWCLYSRVDKMKNAGTVQLSGVLSGPTYTIRKEGVGMTPQTLPVVVDDLRSALGDITLPLAFIMAPGHDVYPYADVLRDTREVQRRAAAKSEGVDLILPGAEHRWMSGQPKDEALLASRCKQWAQTRVYSSKTSAAGPTFDRFEVKGNTGVVHFKAGTAEGLSASGDALAHFQIAGEDGVFHPCKAEIVGATITLMSDKVATPTMVKYGWTLKPQQGLTNKAGLPAIPFTTDASWVFKTRRPYPKVEPNKPHSTIATEASKPPHKAPIDDPYYVYANTSHIFTKEGLTMRGSRVPEFPKEEFTPWRIKVVEALDQAPEGWETPGFDDSSWSVTTLPTSWQFSHRGLLRTTFNVKDVNAYESLLARIGSWKIRSFKIYLNGTLVGDCNHTKGYFPLAMPLKPHAVTLLKNGENHLAVTAEHSFRFFGFGCRLEAMPKKK